MEKNENLLLIEEEENMGIQQNFEEEEEVEQSNGGLKVRDRRKKRENGGVNVIKEINGGSFEKGEKKVEEEEQERSVYLDSEKGSNLQNGAKKDSTNGAEVPKIILPEIINKTEILPTENNSNSNLTNPNTNLTNPTSNYDIEKVLDEQETHDLFCPNCNSCITKRVVLKKRKRTIKDIKSEFRPDKIQNFGVNNLNNDSLSEPLLNNNQENENGEREQHILFKCLSCFTFFIPKDCGFNIFDICGGNKESIQNSQIIEEIRNNVNNTQTKEEVQNVISRETKQEGKNVIVTESKGEIIKSTINSQNSNGISSNNWFLDLFQPGSNKNKPENVEDPSFSYWQNKSKLSDRNQIKNTKNETVVSVKEGKNVETLNTSTVTTSESEIQEIDSTGTTGKLHDISFIASKQEYQIQVVGSVSVTTITEEKINDIHINQESNGGFLFNPSEMKSPKGNFQDETAINLKPVPVLPVQQETVVQIHETTIRPRNCSLCPGVNNWDILKPIVYGGLIEIITSLSIVSSASASGASTLNILLIGVASVIGGFILILHDLMELKRAQDEAGDLNHNELGRYFALLGRKGHFGLHATITIFSYLFFGLLPPLIYGFTFTKTDDSLYKLISVGLSAIFCITILAIGKAHIRPQRNYFTTIVYYVAIGVASSGLAYAVGTLLMKLMGGLGFFGEGFSVGIF